jgi:hypothetical protein
VVRAQTSKKLALFPAREEGKVMGRLLMHPLWEYVTARPFRRRRKAWQSHSSLAESHSQVSAPSLLFVSRLCFNRENYGKRGL